MGYVEVFHMDSEGAGWLDLSDIPAETLLELELGLFNEGALWDKSQGNTPLAGRKCQGYLIG